MRIPRTKRTWSGVGVVAAMALGHGATALGQIGACCLGNGACLDTNNSGCASVTGEFLGAGTTCTPDICLGACCTANKECIVNNRNFCTAAPGSFQGPGSTCELNCPSPLATAFTYQGQLKDGGVPVSDAVDLECSLWTAAIGGTQVELTQSLPGVDVVNGLFTVDLDFGSAAFAGNTRWLQVAVRSPAWDGQGTPPPFVTLASRQTLTAAPNAIRALNAATATNADKLDGLDSTAFLQSITVPLTLSGTNSTHIISGQNASTASNAFGLVGEMSAPLPGFFSAGIRGINRGTGGSGIGVWGSQDGSGWGVYGTTVDGSGVYGLSSAPTGITSGVYGLSMSIGDGRGVYGLASGATGRNYGVFGETYSTSGRGVFGLATAGSGETYGGRFESTSTGGHGVFGEATATTGFALGVHGKSNSTSGVGVLGEATTATGSTRGVYGQSNSNSDGIGVYGLATAGSGVTYGVYGQSASVSGRGVFGHANASIGENYGVYGQSNGSQGRGVFGLAAGGGGGAYGVLGQSTGTSGRGVSGLATAGTTTTYGVLGQSLSTGGWSIFSLGDMGASGAKPFRIDHPDDPVNKYLLHYAAESNEVINFYSGKVTLGDAGEAVVELPHYFAKINKDPRYTLTAVGAPMPMLHVAEEIDEAALSAGATAGAGVAAPVCSFRIAGGAPGAKVSWEVKAVRNDLWVRNRAVPVEVIANGLSIQSRAMPVEIDKQGLEKGTYQHPELYGLSAEMGMNYAAERDLPYHPDTEQPASPHTLGKALTP